METTVKRSTVHRGLRQILRILYGVSGLFALGLVVERIIKRDFSTPLSLVALIGQAWVGGVFLVWAVKGEGPLDRDPLDRDPHLHQGRVLIVLVVLLAIGVYMLLRPR